MHRFFRAYACLSAACLLVLGGCDFPTAPEPSNPYDPDFDGTREATPPSDLHLTASTLRSIALEWTDNSSFETGLRVERATREQRGEPVWEMAATLPPNTTVYTDEAIRSDIPRWYRVVALVAGERSSAPSETLALRHPPGERIAIATTVPELYGTERFSPDGERVYLTTSNSIEVVDTRTGQGLYRYPAADGIAGFLPEDRVAVYVSGSPSEVRIYREGTLVSSHALGSTSACLYPGTDREPVVVSADGTKAFTSCSYRQGAAFGVWRLSDPATPTVYTVDTGVYIVGVSPDNRVAYLASPYNLLAFDLETRRARWSVPQAGYVATLSPDGRALLVRLPEHSRRAALIDADSGATLAEADGLPPGVFRWDGQLVAYAADSYATVSTLYVASTADLVPILEFAQSAGYGLQSAFIPDGLVTISVGTRELIRRDFRRGWETVAGRP